MGKVSALVITKNEERHIGPCLESLVWADEIVVLDAFSTDQTVEIARRYTIRVLQRHFVSFPEQRNAAMSLAAHQWVLFVDADERITPELASEIRMVLDDEDGAGITAGQCAEITTGQGERIAGYWIPRENIIWGKWIRYGGWYPDYQLRLLRRGWAKYDESREVHELVQLTGGAGRLSNRLIHYNYEYLAQFLCKQDLYAQYEARTMFRRGIKPRWRSFVLQPLREFKRHYIDLRGYLDGFHGLLLAVLLAYYNLVTYFRLQRMWQGNL
ncbi:MAG: glycosyltransferase family 2 protein [Chloroflexi bacterium]|nr:glycosyltransferase family 2 protein [Chloroflexota bacterium]MCL5075040.1 glycosyltransferase family 2 protein [Chloroflexota bacterium]